MNIVKAMMVAAIVDLVIMFAIIITIDMTINHLDSATRLISRIRILAVFFQVSSA